MLLKQQGLSYQQKNYEVELDACQKLFSPLYALCVGVAVSRQLGSEVRKERGIVAQDLIERNRELYDDLLNDQDYNHFVEDPLIQQTYRDIESLMSQNIHFLDGAMLLEFDQVVRLNRYIHRTSNNGVSQMVAFKIEVDAEVIPRIGTLCRQRIDRLPKFLPPYKRVWLWIRRTTLVRHDGGSGSR